MILNIIAKILFILLSPINFVVVLFKYGFKLKIINGYFKSSAISLDKYGNRDYRTLFNTTLIKNSKYKFGDSTETISSVLGRNQLNKTLTAFGMIIVFTLFVIDYNNWFKNGHCINAIKNK